MLAERKFKLRRTRPSELLSAAAHEPPQNKDRAARRLARKR